MSENFPENIPRPTFSHDAKDPMVQARMAQKESDAAGLHTDEAFAQQEEQDRADYAAGLKAEVGKRLVARLAEDPFYQPPVTGNRHIDRFRVNKAEYGIVPGSDENGGTGETYGDQRRRLLAEAEFEARDWQDKPAAEKYNAVKIIDYIHAKEDLKKVQHAALNHRRAEQGRPSIDEDPGDLNSFSVEVADAINEGRFPRAMDHRAEHYHGSGEHLAVIHGEVAGLDDAGNHRFARDSTGVYFSELSSKHVGKPESDDPTEARIESLFVPHYANSEEQQIAPEAWDKVMGALEGETERVRQQLPPQPEQHG